MIFMIKKKINHVYRPVRTGSEIKQTNSHPTAQEEHLPNFLRGQTHKEGYAPNPQLWSSYTKETELLL